MENKDYKMPSRRLVYVLLVANIIFSFIAMALVPRLSAVIFWSMISATIAGIILIVSAKK